MPLTKITPGAPWDDLKPVSRIIGNATVVALSEAVHEGAQPLEFRNRLFQYLVENHGFTAIAIESGLVEGRTVHDYVRGGPGDIEKVLSQGISWTFDRLPQNRALVRWMREYNADPRHMRKIDFYGFDVPGSPGNSMANRNMDTALGEALDYLARVDATAASELRARVAKQLAHLRFANDAPPETPSYDKLSREERDALSASIADLITLLERRQAQYSAASSAKDYEWGYRAAIGARQADGWLRQIPVEWRASKNALQFSREQMRFLSTATDVRDRAQADNVSWIVDQEGPSGKVLVYAARYHLSAAPLATTWWDRRQYVAGTYLRERFGPRYLPIGNLIQKGEAGCHDPRRALPVAPPESIDGLAADVGPKLFMLDLRKAPPSVAAWFDREHSLGEGENAFKMVMGKAFDVFFYVETVTPGC